ncbi:hypothetical protein [Streptococcus gordonii]|uniref:hypothetical protein n=1 Tax=Streptococcus gordonii TaxID=1302 RepID=UPI00059FB830|nr:hypothetical protein [Streptococcus gordonii]MBZ2138369.1 hypothetical protein [Streptococcus gordonii]QGS44458.1 hypothetical protein FOB91_07135 [Streptococcus gordonii]VEE20160.1 Uncharacterised protein [Streptococcus gordonii]VTS76383.1 Uncharacterised protein [Streptococcus gordonii]
MGKKFEDMSFDELKLYRREGLWRSIGLLIEIIVLIIGMLLMELNHVAFSNRNHFRIIGFIITLGLLSYIRPIFGANQVMRNHPDWIRKSGFKAKIPLPKEWHIKRFCVIGVNLIVIIVSFFFLYKPQS